MLLRMAMPMPANGAPRLEDRADSVEDSVRQRVLSGAAQKEMLTSRQRLRSEALRKSTGVARQRLRSEAAPKEMATLRARGCSLRQLKNKC